MKLEQAASPSKIRLNMLVSSNIHQQLRAVCGEEEENGQKMFDGEIYMGMWACSGSARASIHRMEEV